MQSLTYNRELLSIKFETFQRGLCCFPSLSNKNPPNQPLLSDEVSVLSTNNSDAFLQKLAHLNYRERERHELESQANKTKSEDIILLEKQGRCSQKIRNNISGNLVQVTQNVGQNMTDISNIGEMQDIKAVSLPSRKERGNSLPPSALPRPPRHLKPPKKTEYNRLSDTEANKQARISPKNSGQRVFDNKNSTHLSSLFPQYSSTNGYNSLKEQISFHKNNIPLIRKNYGAISKRENIQGKKSLEFPKSEFTSTKDYQILDELSLKSLKNQCDSNLIKNSRKLNTSNTNKSDDTKNLRGLFNSNRSNISPQVDMHPKIPSKCTHSLGKRKEINENHLAEIQRPQTKSLLPIPNNPTNLPPKPIDGKNQRRGSISRYGENRYKIQF